ncbi:MAG: DUF3526 domain-containing protein [Polyangiaceae bacterium]|jgi:ABC-2 type transport system permease protein|nr:DUF3526 domain-containing protein [Polyangiaceae bacterium]
MTFFAQLRWEWRLAVRSRATLATLGLLLGLLAAGAIAGLGAAGRVRREVDAARAEEVSRRSKLRAGLEAIERGAAPPGDEWNDPRRAGFWLEGAARLIAREPTPLAALAPGTLERERPVALVGGLRAQNALEPEPLRSPRRFAEGSVELGSVLAWLLPLFVIALTFDATSRERERGSLALALAQGVSPSRFLAAKVLAFALPVAVAASATIAAIAALGTPRTDVAGLALGATGVVAYVGVWAGTAAWVNTWGRPSAVNAVALLGLWLLTAIALPLGASAAARAAFAPPSRIEAIVTARAASAPVRSEGSKLLKQYYEDHPELARERTDLTDFMKKLVLVEDRVAAAIAPFDERHDRALEEQQALAGRLLWLSPALTVTSLFESLAGSDPAAGRAFRAEVRRAHEGLRAFVLPRLYGDVPMRAADVDALPPVAPVRARGVGATAVARVAWLAALGAGLWALAMRRARRGLL